MARKEYRMIDIVDILRRCQRGDTIRSLARATGMGRNTVKRYLRLAYKKGFTLEGPCDLETIAGEVLAEVNARFPGPAPWKVQTLMPHKEEIRGWRENERLTLTKIHRKLTRQGIETTYPSLYRFVASEIGLPAKTTVRMAETAPGEVAEIDFGRLGLVEPLRDVHLIITFLGAFPFLMVPPGRAGREEGDVLWLFNIYFAPVFCHLIELHHPSPLFI